MNICFCVIENRIILSKRPGCVSTDGTTEVGYSIMCPSMDTKNRAKNLLQHAQQGICKSLLIFIKPRGVQTTYERCMISNRV